MRLRNIVIVVKNIEKSVAFYREMFGLEIVLNQGETIILTEGLVLQEKHVWEQALKRGVIPKNHASELYFEEANIEGFVKKLEEYPFEFEYVTPFTQYPSGKKVIRFYDLDGHLIEVGN